jgi:hypothetical protein
MRTILIDEVEASLGQSTRIFDTPNRTIIGMVGDHGLGVELQDFINAFRELEERYQGAINRLNILEEKLENVDGSKALVKVGQIVEIDASISDMSEFMGYGSWELFGRGRMTICSGSIIENGVTHNFNVSQIGGEVLHILSIQEMPAHSHKGYVVLASRSWKYGPSKSEGEGSVVKNGNTENTGDGQAHNNMPPYIVIQRWKRVG